MGLEVKYFFKKPSQKGLEVITVSG